MSAPPGWEDILDPGEEILWQGRPEARFDWAGLISLRMPFGLAFTGFALFWMTMTSGLRGGPPFPVNLLFLLFGLPFLAAGLSIAFGEPVARWLRLRGSYYTLTNRHAFIATTFLGRRKLERYRPGPALRPVLEEGLPGSVWFATRQFDTKTLQDRNFLGFAQSVGIIGERIGFENIPEARRVFRLMIERLTPDDGGAG